LMKEDGLVRIDTTRRRPMRRPYWLRKATLIVGAATAALVMLLVGSPAQAGTAAPVILGSIQPSVNDLAAAHAAIGQDPAVFQALLARARSNPSLAKAMLQYATTEDEVTTTSDARSPATTPIAQLAAIKPGCTGSFTDRHTIKFPSTHFGVTIAWQEVTEHGFCWNGKRITWWGGHTVRRWSAFAYCWNDTSDGDVWNSYPKWRETFAYGVLGGNSGFGCISLQGDEPHMYYANGGGVFKH